MDKSSIWNVQNFMKPIEGYIEREARSPLEAIPVMECHFGRRPISVLEIGVFQAGLTKRIAKSKLNVRAYHGVDPYLGGVRPLFR
jgi:hypothetical protein